jgi:hypothetical protein
MGYFRSCTAEFARITIEESRKAELIRIRGHAASINGQLTIQSEAGKGICVCVSLGKNIL